MAPRGDPAELRLGDDIRRPERPFGAAHRETELADRNRCRVEVASIAGLVRDVNASEATVRSRSEREGHLPRSRLGVTVGHRRQEQECCAGLGASGRSATRQVWERIEVVHGDLKYLGSPVV